MGKGEEMGERGGDKGAKGMGKKEGADVGLKLNAWYVMVLISPWFICFASLRNFKSLKAYAV